MGDLGMFNRLAKGRSGGIHRIIQRQKSCMVRLKKARALLETLGYIGVSRGLEPSQEPWCVRALPLWCPLQLG